MHVPQLMMMEAMRLSLLEHEEHQRREAANNQQNGEAAPGTPERPASTESTPPTESPTPNVSIADDGLASALTIAAPRPTISAAEPATSALPTTNAIAIESPRQASTPNNAEPSAPLNNMQRGPASPPPFSTLAAAMSATNAATAILSNHGGTGNSTASRDTAAASTTAPVPPPDTGKPINIPVAPMPDRPTLASEHMSFASSMFSTESNEQDAGPTYDVLESDTDGEFARQPLLASDPPTPTEGSHSVPEGTSSALESQSFA